MARRNAKAPTIRVRIDGRLKSIPNKQTIAAMAEANDPARLKRYRSFRGLREGVSRWHFRRFAGLSGNRPATSLFASLSA
jgi:hypothetical protein